MAPLLQEIDPAMGVHQAASRAAAETALRDHPSIALILLDLGLPDCDGLEFLRQLRSDRPEVGVVVLSGSGLPAQMREAMALGALGFIPKTQPRAILVGALQLVLAGGLYIPPDALLAPATSPLPLHRQTPDEAGLTARQTDILALLVAGASNKEICRRLDIAEPTVKNHVTAILRILGADNRTEAAVMASRFDWTRLRTRSSRAPA